ncbi:hypothetical protein [uncultured Gemmiger sp.]|uniref:hypothetical protein n=1 Tax=uncultured Gemmiger sp. TaxID=1623490 RepID=UPI0025F75586|nr:hypothetical protein [uncultured Gemmiger sp.]
MAVGLGAGALAWHGAVSGTLHALANRLGRAVLTAAQRVQDAAAAPFVHLRRLYVTKKQTKIALKAKKSTQKVTKRKKQLQKQRKILYN